VSAPKRTFGLLDAALVAAGVIGAGYLVVRVLDVHRHTCCACGSTWAHAGAMLRDRVSAHTCPGCGSEQWWRLGEGTPEQRAAYMAAHPELAARAA
jgi:hypothetical protein